MSWHRNDLSLELTHAPRAAIAGVCGLSQITENLFAPMLRFTIRDVLWLTVVVAMGCGWWLHVWSVKTSHDNQLEQINRRILQLSEDAEAELKQLHAKYPSQNSN